MKTLVQQFIDLVIENKHEEAKQVFHEYLTQKTTSLVESDRITQYGMGDYETDPEAWDRAGLGKSPVRRSRSYVSPEERAAVDMADIEAQEKRQKRREEREAQTKYIHTKHKTTESGYDYNHIYRINAIDLRTARGVASRFYDLNRYAVIQDVTVGKSEDPDRPVVVDIYYWENVPGDSWPEGKQFKKNTKDALKLFDEVIPWVKSGVTL